MINGKMADLIQGDSGAFCHYCTVTREQANDIKQIEEGFKINKSAQQCMQTWQAVDGEMAYSSTSQAG